MDKTTIINQDDYRIYFHPPRYLADFAIAITAAGKGFTSGRVVNRRYPDNAFVFSQSDGAMIDFRGSSLQLKRNDCFFIPELEQHSYGALEGQFWDSYWITFKAAKQITEVWEKLLPWVENVPDIRLKKLNEDIRLGYLQGEAAEFFSAKLFELMAVLRNPKQPEPSATEQAIENTRQFIAENISKNLTVEDIAEKANLSATHFSRLFKKRYGTSVRQYIINRKIALAQTLLATTRLSIKEISARAGFQDQLYFSRLFSAKLHISPSDFRKFYRF